MQNQTQNKTVDLKQMFLMGMLTTSFGGGTTSTYVIVPMSVLGTIFNAISLLIFFKKSFRSIALFKYMQVYTTTSLVITSSLIFGFYFNVTQLYEISISYSARIYKCLIIPSYVVTLFFFYGNVMDIFINVERALNFSNRFPRFKKMSPYITSLIAFVISLILNIPNFFIYEIVEDKDLFIKFRLCVPSKFNLSTIGKIFQIASYIIGGPVVLILEIASNIVSMICFRNYMNRKSTLQSNKNMDKKQRKKQKKIDKMEKKLLFMTFYLSGYSILMHIVQFASQIIIFILGTNPTLVSVFTFLYAFIMSLKHSSNIFFYYFFNYNFRRSLKFCKSIRSNEETSAKSTSNDLPLKKNLKNLNFE